VGTTLGYLEVGPGRGSGKEAGCRVAAEESAAAGPKGLALDSLDDFIVVSDIKPDIDAWECLLETAFVSFYIAASSDHKRGPFFALQADSVFNSPGCFFPGRPDEPTGVDDDDIGFLRVGQNGIASTVKIAKHNFAVNHVFSAAVTDERDGLSSACMRPGHEGHQG
jgi:hypothetical protein